jgi:Flp pilus assembly protein TadG
MLRISRNRRSGSALAETAATIVFVLPLMILVVFVAMEAIQTYGLWQCLQQGARESARLLATTYAVDPGIKDNATDQATYGFTPVRVTNVINDNSQFAASFDANAVTVIVTYHSDQHGLPKFPRFDPLHLGSGFTLKATASYTLEGGSR